MAITRAAVEGVLVGRCGPWMTRVGMAVTTAGANGDLTDALRLALGEMGRSPADPLVIGDSELAFAVGSLLDELLDRAELRVLRTVQRRFVKVDLQVDTIRQGWGDLHTEIARAVKDQEERVRRAWGPGQTAGGTLASSVLAGGFQESWPDELGD